MNRPRILTNFSLTEHERQILLAILTKHYNDSARFPQANPNRDVIADLCNRLQEK